MMERVIQGGTGTVARFVNGEGKYQPAAGKTGTTEDFADAWFIGFTPKICTAVWVGNDDFRIKMRRVFGATIPAPIWRDFMKEVYKDRKVENFANPPGVGDISIPSASARPPSSLSDIQVEGDYYYSFAIDIEKALEEEEKKKEEEEKKKAEEQSAQGEGEASEEHEVYF